MDPPVCDHMLAMDGSAPIIALRHRVIAQPLESLGVPRTSQLFSLDATAAGVWPREPPNPRIACLKSRRSRIALCTSGMSLLIRGSLPEL